MSFPYQSILYFLSIKIRSIQHTQIWRKSGGKLFSSSCEELMLKYGIIFLQFRVNLLFEKVLKWATEQYIEATQQFKEKLNRIFLLSFRKRWTNAGYKQNR